MPGSKRRSPESGLSRLLDGVGRLVDRVPGGTLVTRSARSVESTALGLLRERLDRLPDGGPDSAAGVSAAGGGRGAPTLQALLDEALEQDRAGALHALCARILAQLVPDEARILAALADGAAYPLIHVMSAPRVGGTSRRLLDNVSSVGKKAGVQLRDRAPYYIAHLRAFELAETGPEDEGAQTEYQLLETDAQVRRVIEHVERQGGGMKARIVRRTLRISEFGRDFWAACQAPAGGGAA